MPKYGIRASISEDRERVTLELLEDDKTLGHVWYEAPELEHMIASLGRLRAQLNDPVPERLDIGARLEALVDPHWMAEWSSWPDGPILALRHLGLGWLSFAIPAGEAQTMAQVLSTRPSPAAEKGSGAD
jgi:hypothetical protein